MGCLASQLLSTSTCFFQPNTSIKKKMPKVGYFCPLSLFSENSNLIIYTFLWGFVCLQCQATDSLCYGDQDRPFANPLRYGLRDEFQNTAVSIINWILQLNMNFRVTKSCINIFPILSIVGTQKPDYG